MCYALRIFLIELTCSRERIYKIIDNEPIFINLLPGVDEHMSRFFLFFEFHPITYIDFSFDLLPFTCNHFSFPFFVHFFLFFPDYNRRGFGGPGVCGL